MTRRPEPQLYFCRRKFHRLGPFSRREILERLLAGGFDGAVLVRRADDPVLRPLPDSELAGLLTETGRIWCRWGAPCNLWLILLLLPLLNTAVLRWCAPTEELPLFFGALPLVLAAGGGLLFWLYLIWRIVLGDTGPGRSLRRVLPLAVPGVQLIWVWPGYFALARVLRILNRKQGGGDDETLSTGLFTAAIILGYLVFFGVAGEWFSPVFRTLPAVYETIFLALSCYVVTLFSLLRADRAAMLILERRVKNLLRSLPGTAPRADLSPIFRAEALLSDRLRLRTQVIALLLALCGLLPQLALDYRAATEHSQRQFQRRIARPRQETDDPGMTAAALETVHRDLSRAVRERNRPEAMRLLEQMADLLRATQEEYAVLLPRIPLHHGRRLLRHGEAVLEQLPLDEAQLLSFAELFRDEEYRLRRSGAEAVRRRFHRMLRDPAAASSFRMLAILEAAEVLSGCVWLDLHEILPDLMPGAAQNRSLLLRRPENDAAALDFLVRENTLILYFRMLRTAALLRSRARGRDGLPDELTELRQAAEAVEVPCNPLTGEPLQYGKVTGPDFTGFRLSAGPWPGVPEQPAPALFAPEITVRLRRGEAE